MLNQNLENNLLELAWAAGFFDGEGSTLFKIQHPKHARVTTRRLEITINQRADNKEVLDRFLAAVGVGKIYGPYYNGASCFTYRFNTTKFEDSRWVVEQLWRFLSKNKREQADKAIQSYLNHDSSGG